MNDAGFVRRFQRLGDLPRDGQGFVKRNRSLRDPIGEGEPIDKLQDERVHRRSLRRREYARYGDD
jgi:hypothetical protein